MNVVQGLIWCEYFFLNALVKNKLDIPHNGRAYVPAVGTVQDILAWREVLVLSVTSWGGGGTGMGWAGLWGGGDGSSCATGWTLPFLWEDLWRRCYRETVSGRLRPSSQGWSENTVTPERAHSFTLRARGSTWPFLRASSSSGRSVNRWILFQFFSPLAETNLTAAASGAVCFHSWPVAS